MATEILKMAIDQLSRLPGIGERSAERIAFHCLSRSIEEIEELSNSLIQLKLGLKFCSKCNHLSEYKVCSICSDMKRDKEIICIVEDTKDVIAIEKTGTYNGKYHVLLGVINPIDGKGPESLKLDNLWIKLEEGRIKEIIIATDADNDGEMTALYLIKRLKQYNIKVSRIGVGLPAGGAIEYIDGTTLSLSLKGRKEVVAL